MKICIQAGHKGMLIGATGAPGERDWTSNVVPKVANILRDKGWEVYETDAKGYNDSTVTDTDWDLFLAVHYDSDDHDSRGGFTDFPDPSVDQVVDRSRELAEGLADYYFQNTGIPEISRSNPNTKFYYMWNALSSQTPCVIIECGVGWRKPNDYEVLRHEGFPQKLADSISFALGEEPVSTCEKELDKMRDSRNGWRFDYKELEKKYVKDIQEKDKDLDGLSEKLAIKEAANTELLDKVSTLTTERDSLLRHKKRLEGIVGGQEDEIDGQSVEIDELETKLKLCKDGNSLFAYSWGERFLSLFMRGGVKNETN